MANQESNTLIYALVGFLAGALIAVLFARTAVNNNNMDMMRMMGMRRNQQTVAKQNEMMIEHDEGMSMDGMVEALEGKTGDDFDKEFIELMIEHHQGAIDMANLGKTNAKHQEIKDLADDIISAQTSEIKMMRDWQTNWGY